MELVSVVIPIYKPDEELLHLAITSVFQQDYSSWELIISDDGDSYDLINKFKDTRIKYFKNSGAKGIFPNLNNAIRHASGRYIQIFCQDDILLQGCITDQVRLLEKYPDAAMGFSGYIHVLPNNAAEQGMDDNSLTEFMASHYFYNTLFVYGCMPGNLSPVILRKERFSDLGPFDENYKYCGDHEYWVRLAERFSACYSHRKNFFIRLHNKQASNTLPLISKLDETIIIYRKLLKRNTVKAGKWVKWLYINQRLGVYFFKLIVKQCLKGNLKYSRNLKKLHNDVFNLPIILGLCIMTLGGKIRLIKIDPKRL